MIDLYDRILHWWETRFERTPTNEHHVLVVCVRNGLRKMGLKAGFVNDEDEVWSLDRGRYQLNWFSIRQTDIVVAFRKSATKLECAVCKNVAEWIKYHDYGYYSPTSWSVGERFDLEDPDFLTNVYEAICQTQENL